MYSKSTGIFGKIDYEEKTELSKSKAHSYKWARKYWCVLWHTQGKNQSLIARTLLKNNLLHIFPTSLWWDGLYQSQRIGSLSVQCSAGSVLCYKHLFLVLSFEEGTKQKMDSASSSCHAFVQEENNCVSTFLQPGHATLIQQLVLWDKRMLFRLINQTPLCLPKPNYSLIYINDFRKHSTPGGNSQWGAF